MNKDSATVLPYIFFATIVTYVSTFAPPREELTIDPLIGMFIIGAILLLIGLWFPEIATALALLILITSLVINGTRVFGAVNNVRNTTGAGGQLTPVPGSDSPGSNPRAGGGGGGFGAR